MHIHVYLQQLASQGKGADVARNGTALLPWVCEEVAREAITEHSGTVLMECSTQSQ